MKTKFLFGTIFLVLFLFSQKLYADVTAVPELMSAPVVLFDEGNNLLSDGDYLVTISLKSTLTGAVIYSEEQRATISNGVANLVMGQGYAPGSNLSAPAGGLVWNYFNFDEDIAVEILVEGQSSPQQITVLGSQPYSYISQYALGVAPSSITSASVQNGTIKAEDLDASFLSSLQTDSSSSSGTPENTLTSTIASNVLVSTDIGLNNASGTDVETVLRQIDGAIDTLRDVHLGQGLEGVENTISNLNFSNIGGEISDSQIPISVTRDSELTTQVTSLSSTISSLTFSDIGGTASDGQIPSSIARDSELISAISGLTFSSIGGVALDSQIPDSITRDSELNASIATVNSTISSLTFGNIGGTASDGQIPSSIARDSELSSSVGSKLDLSGGTMSGDINMNGNNVTNIGASGHNLDSLLNDLVILLDNSIVDRLPKAFGRRTDNTCTRGYNVASNCQFIDPLPDANYVVILTPHGSGFPQVTCKAVLQTTTGFSMLCYGEFGGPGPQQLSSIPDVDFIVFHNP